MRAKTLHSPFTGEIPSIYNGSQSQLKQFEMTKVGRIFLTLCVK